MSWSQAIFGIAAKTQRGHTRLRAGLGDSLPRTFPRASRAWWTNSDAGLALHAPTAQSRSRRGNGEAILCARGATYREQTVSNVAEPTHGKRFIDELCRRDLGALADTSGEFSLAFWDGGCERLVLARDHLGQRDLFVRDDDDFHLFCSELEPLLSDPAFTCELDMQSAFHYLACGLPPAGHTLAQRVSRVRAGHALTWEPGRALFAQRYFTPLRPDAKKLADDDLRGSITETLDAAIRRRLTPGKQALLLSGGVDSSYLAATSTRFVGAEQIEAYSVEFAAPYDRNETEHARMVAQAHGIRHRVVTLGPDAALRILEERVLRAAQPCSAWATVTHHHLLARIRKHGHRHLLSGLGADEVFGGYLRFLKFYARWHKLATTWSAADSIDAIDALLWNSRAARTRLYPGVACFFDDKALRSALRDPYRDWHYGSQLEEFYRECRRLKPNAHPFELMVAHECERRVPDLLFADFEPVGRGLGLRSAYPFLDPQVASTACGLGATSRFVHNGTWVNKILLRQIAAARIPPEILARPLRSYTAPFLDWMATPSFARPTLARLRRSGLWKTGLLHKSWLSRLESELARELSNRKQRKPAPCVDQLWALLTLAAWHDTWVDKP